MSGEAPAAHCVRPTDGWARRTVSGAVGAAARTMNRLAADVPVQERIAAAGVAMAAVLRAGGRLLACGNGGSMCDAMHFTEELTGNFRRPRPPLSALALSDAGHLTCVGNDFGYEQVFARGVHAHGRPGDLLLAISTSGGSPNVLAAADAAHEIGMTVVALTGRAGSPLGARADVDVATESGDVWADRVQEMHGVVLHVWIEVIEEQLFGRAPA